MKLVSYQGRGAKGIGVLDGENIIPISKVSDMINLIHLGDEGRTLAQAALEAREEAIPASEITYLPPVVRPGKVIALGRNYAAHAAEGGAEPPKYPMLFHKTHTSLNGANCPVVIPEGTKRVDYEAELAVIIGKTCKNVSEAGAFDYVYGYAAANDITARDWQRLTSQFTAGKMVDGFGPLGPTLVTADEIEDVQNLNITSHYNGQLMQSSNTKMMIFSVAFTIEYISKICTLEPGDVILTGTPEGVGYARKPPVYMQPGDEIVVEVEKVGVLKNHFVE
ncbi:MAG: fumarylacetoacetate hydrolase family protein [Chloroflexota bacterium]